MSISTADTQPEPAASFISFNPIRSIGIPGTRYVKPDQMLRNRRQILAAPMLLFPRHWQVNSLVYGLGKTIFPGPAAYHLGRDKVEMTRGLMAACPEMVPQTGIYARGQIGFDALADQYGLPFICKEIQSSSGLGVFRIRSQEDFNAYACENEVVYVQEDLELDRDLRVVVVGDQVVAAYWRIRPANGFHNNIARGGRADPQNVPEFAVQKTAALAARLGIDYAGFDLAVTETGIFILEFNLWFGTRGLGLSSAQLGGHIHRHLVRKGIEQRRLGSNRPCLTA